MTMDESNTLRVIREELKEVRRIVDELLQRATGQHPIYTQRRCAECFGEVTDDVHHLCCVCLHKGEGGR